jgi:integrase
MSTYTSKKLKKAVEKAGFIPCPKCGVWYYRNERHACDQKLLFKNPTVQKPCSKGLSTKVYPIYETEHIQMVKDYIKAAFPKMTAARNLCAFIWAINSNLRFTDIVALRMENVALYPVDLEDFKPGYSFHIIENKTKKQRDVYVNENMGIALAEWLKHRGCKNGYLFCHTKGGKPNMEENVEKPLNPTTFRIVLHEIGKKLGIKLTLRGLRKTWCYHAWKSGVPIEVLSQAMNHFNPAITYRYLGIKNEDIKAAFMTGI